MSTETVEISKEIKIKKPLISVQNKKLLTEPLNESNPITVQILGICSALAVTVQMKPSIVMALSVMVVTAFSNMAISAIRNTIPDRIRIIVQLVIVAALVILVDQILKAFVYDVSKQLSVFVGLIITNCIVMGRLEAFAMGNKPVPSFIDGIGNGLGYGLILVIVSAIRELFGSGKLMGYQVVPDAFYEMGYKNNGLVILPPMALIIVGVIIWIQRSRNPKLIDQGK
jgi:Na+-transporting NADH:ubiquinone oxidoreductase subunit D